ncbi:hypothetical protein ABTK38_21525, partial [Acinetobacter baumannii]
AARRAKLDPAKVHAEYLEKQPSTWEVALANLLHKNDDDDASGNGGDAFAIIARQQHALLNQAIGDVKRLTQGGSVQARCLECAGFAP